MWYWSFQNNTPWIVLLITYFNLLNFFLKITNVSYLWVILTCLWARVQGSCLPSPTKYKKNKLKLAYGKIWVLLVQGASWISCFLQALLQVHTVIRSLTPVMRCALFTVCEVPVLTESWLYTRPLGGGGTPWNFWWGCAATQFQTKKAIFHPRFQTWPQKSILVFRPDLDFQMWL